MKFQVASLLVLFLQHASGEHVTPDTSNSNELDSIIQDFSFNHDIMSMADLFKERQSSANTTMHLNVKYSSHPHESYEAQDEVTNFRRRKIESELSSKSPMESRAVPSTSPIRIVYDTTELELNTQSNQKNAVRIVKQKILPKIADIWSSILRVYPVMDPIKIPRETCNGLFPNIPSSLVSKGVSDADTVIFVSGMERAANGKRLCGAKSLASASYCMLDQVDRPVVGFINFCLDNIYSNQIDKLINVGTHELAHVFGVNDDLLKYFRDRDSGKPLTSRPFKEVKTNCVDGSKRMLELPSTNTLKQSFTTYDGHERLHYEVVTPKVKLAVQNQFGCDSVEGAILENQPTKNSCIGAHFDERLFFTETMSPIYSSKYSSVLSPVTVALLEDSGWYDVDYTSKYVKNSPFGLGAGCDFVNDKCIDAQRNQVAKPFQNFFCDITTKFSATGIDSSSDTTCDPTGTHVAFCDLFDFSSSIPSGFPTPTNTSIQYFENPDLGVLFTHADYCPVPALLRTDCTDSSNFDFQKTYSSEEYGSTSRCFNTQMTSSQDSQKNRGACFATQCNPQFHNFDVMIDGQRITCEYDGQIHEFPFISNTSFTCPPVHTICPEISCPSLCSGNGKCNYESNPPKCDCFDELDKSSGCFGRDYVEEEDVDKDENTIVQILSYPSSSASLRSARVFRLGILFLAMLM